MAVPILCDACGHTSEEVGPDGACTALGCDCQVFEGEVLPGGDLIEACVALVRVYADGRYTEIDDFIAAVDEVVRVTRLEAVEQGIALEATS